MEARHNALPNAFSLELSDGAQHMKLEGRVCDARGHEHEYDGGGDEEQFTIEAHAYN